MFESYLKPPISFPTLTGSIVTFNAQYALPLYSHKIALTATQSGSGTPSPDNVRTINGVSAIHIQNTAGINQWDEVWENGTINSTTGENEPNSAYIRSKNFIRINPNTNYYYKTSAPLRLVYYDINKAFVGIANANNATVSSPANAYYVRFYPNTSSYGSTYKDDISINYPSTDTSYHAFVGTSATIQIGSTVYGGEYDARTGVLTVTYGVVDLGTLNWNRYITESTNKTYFRTSAEISDCIKSTSVNLTYGMTCSNYVEGAWTNVLDASGYDLNFALGWGGRSYIVIYDTSKSEMTAAEFKTDMNGVQLMYPLATPIEIQLPPCPIDTTGVGVQNIWADTGDTTLQYIKLG